LEKNKSCYNGYSCDGIASVYNPFSTLLFFKNRRFGNFWFNSATPTFLLDILRKRKSFKPLLKPFVSPGLSFTNFDPEHINVDTLLFLSGYLTIKKVQQDPLFITTLNYTIDFPNEEVRNSFLTCLLSDENRNSAETGVFVTEMRQQLLFGDVSGLEQNLRLMLSYIPYSLRGNKEADYHIVFLIWLRLLGFEIEGEIITNIGRIDAVWQFPGHTIIAEVKFDREATDLTPLLDSALGQIKEKRYAERYQDGRKISILAIAFTDKEIRCRMGKL
jgi:hypothetical protein